MLGLHHNRVRLEGYDPKWPDIYEREANAIRAALKSNCAQIAHIGSTSVAGLEAKPIIDIAVQMPTGAKVDETEATLCGLGYLSKGEFGLPGRYFFTKGEPTSFHVHVVSEGCGHWNRWLLFRDVLRSNKNLREAYRALKSNLADKFVSDRAAYTAAKTEFITRVIAQKSSH